MSISLASDAAMLIGQGEVEHTRIDMGKNIMYKTISMNGTAKETTIMLKKNLHKY